MDFDLTEEQRLLKDSVNRLIADQYAFEQRKKYMAEPSGWSQTIWSQLAELGLLGLPFEEQYGGFGGAGVETMIVMEAFGRGLVLEPYFATVILGGGLEPGRDLDFRLSHQTPQVDNPSVADQHQQQPKPAARLSGKRQAAGRHRIGGGAILRQFHQSRGQCRTLPVSRCTNGEPEVG